MSEAIPRCGDTVRHLPSGETWEVAYADAENNDLSWFGWPAGRAKLSECTLVAQCTDEEHARAVAQWLDSWRADSSSDDRRSYHVRRLYRPMEHARMEEHARIQAITEALEGLRHCGLDEDALAPIIAHLEARKAAVA